MRRVSDYAELARDWDEAANGVPAHQVTVDETERWWRCSDGHSWRAPATERAAGRRRCRLCWGIQSSQPENDMWHALSDHLDLQPQGSRVTLPGVARPRFPDALDLGRNLVIEYDGSYWHRGRETQDYERIREYRAAGLRCIRIREAPLTTITSDDLQVPSGTTGADAAALVLAHLSALGELPAALVPPVPFIAPPATRVRENGPSHLEDFIAEHGHANVPAAYVTEDGFQLGQWLCTRRYQRRQGTLKPGLDSLLTDLGVDWGAPVARSRDATWRLTLTDLSYYWAEHGLGVTPTGEARSANTDVQLREWLNTQRRRANQGALPVWKREALDEVCPTWNRGRVGNPSLVRTSAHQARFQQRLGDLKAFAAANGHVLVSKGDKALSDGADLWEWINKQRKAYRAGELEADEVRDLENLGVVWDAVSAREQRFDHAAARVAAFRAARGHADVPVDYRDSDGFPLGKWLGTVRGERRAGRLSARREQALAALGVHWDMGAGNYLRNKPSAA